MTRLRLAAVAGVLAAALLLAACGGGNDEKEAAESTAAAGGTQAAQTGQTVKRGGTLTVTLSNNPKVFDPMVTNDVPSNTINTNVYEGLFKYDENYKPVPWLAESVETSPESSVWTFHLRQGVKFHDGTEMDAEAVKFSMDRVRNNPASPSNSDAKPITDISVVDKYTVKVTLSEPLAPFPSRLTFGLGYIVSPTAVKTMGDEKFGLNPVGTGPFKFDEWSNDNFVRVVKNENYWRDGADGQKLPYLDKVEWRIMTEATARLTALQTGDVDIATALRDLDMPIAKKDSNLVVEQTAGLGWGGMWLSINHPPFDSKALRQAVAFAVDREEVNRTIYNGERTYAHSPIPSPLSWAIDPDYKPYPEKADIAKAKQKLAEGGKPDGFSFDYWISAGDQTAQQLGELLQSQLAKAGITMNIQTADFNGVVVPKLLKQESDAYQITLNGGQDPDWWVANAFETGGGFNHFPYSNPQVNELAKLGRATTDLEQRAKIYKEITRLIMEDSPYIHIVYSLSRYTGRKNVQGWFVGNKATAGYSEFWKE